MKNLYKKQGVNSLDNGVASDTISRAKVNYFHLKTK